MPGLRQIAFFIVPSAMAFFALGDVVAAGLYQSGKFTHGGFRIRLGNHRGLGCRPLGVDARPPLRFHLLRAARYADAAALSRRCASRLRLDWDTCARCRFPRWLGIDPHWGAAGLTASAGVAGWVEFTLLRRSLNTRIGATGVPAPLIAKLWGSAAVGAAAAWGIKLALGHAHPIATAMLVLVPYGLIYFAVTYLLRVEECGAMFERLGRLRR